VGDGSNTIETRPPRDSESLRNELLGSRDRLQRLVTEGEAGGRRRREGTAGTPNVRRVDPRRLDAMDPSIGRDGDVDREFTGDGSASCDHEASTEGCQPVSYRGHICRRLHIGSGQDRNLAQIRCHDRSKRKEAIPQCDLEAGITQPGAPAVDQHRIDHRRGQTAGQDAVGDQHHSLDRSEQTDLDRGERQTRDDAVELCLEEIGRSRLHPVHRSESLCRDRRDSNRAVHPECSKRREIGGDARTAKGIVRGDGQDDRWAGSHGNDAPTREDDLVTTRGHLLVASPTMTDPNFAFTVIFMLEHDPEGALGVVLTRPSELPMAELFDQWGAHAAVPAVVHRGGPVSPSSVISLAVANGTVTPTAFSPVSGRIGTIDLDAEPSDILGLQGLRAFGGYAGWSSGQLEAELHGDAWLVVEARPHDILHPQPETLWWEVVGRQPGAVRLLRHYPEEPWLN